MRRAFATSSGLGSLLFAIVTTTGCVGTSPSEEDLGSRADQLTLDGGVSPLISTGPILSIAADRRWDFEDATLQGFVASGSAFARQPTYGANVSAERALRTSEYRVVDDEDRAVVAQLNATRAGTSAVGGDFWKTPYPTGSRGSFFVGSGENRMGFSEPWGGRQPDSATGTLTSPEFVVEHGTLEMLVGGGCDEANLHVRVEVKNTSPWVWWSTATTPSGALVRATGKCSEVMRRVRLDLSRVRGRTARIVIADQATAAPWGHISVDELLLTNFPRTLPDWKHSAKVFGFADLHTHLMNHLGTRSWDGGRLEAQALWGFPGGSIESYASTASAAANMAADLPGCNDTHTISGGYTVARDIVLNSLEGAGLFGAQYHNTDGGFPYFRAWPRWNTAVHQQMHVTWLHRAYQGGLRVLVADVGNSELMGYALGGGGGHTFTSDLEAIETQVAAIREFARVNASWMEIALGPKQARRIINEGKLAVIMGVEVDDPMDGCGREDVPRRRHPAQCSCTGPQNCDTTNGWTKRYGDGGFDVANQSVLHVLEPHNNCGEAGVRLAVDKLHRLGVRKIIPTHLADNELGGAAIYSDTFSSSQVFSHDQCQPYDLATSSASISFKAKHTTLPTWNGSALHTPDRNEAGLAPALVLDPGSPLGHVNRVGLLGPGRAAIAEMKRRGMLIDLQHSSDASKDAMLQTGAFLTATTSPLADPLCTDLRRAECRKWAYPVLSSHGGPRMLVSGDKGSENSLTNDQLFRIIDMGGLIGVGMNPGKSPRYPGTTNAVVADCAGSSKANAQAFMKLRDMFEGRGLTPQVAFGSDINGFDYHANPRFGAAGCYHEGEGLPVLGADCYKPFDPTAPLSSGTSTTCSHPRADAGLAAAALQTAAVRYTYPTGTTAPTLSYGSNPALTPVVIRDGSGTITRVFDVNVDGLAHYGLVPDYVQDLANVGVTKEQLGALFQSAEAVLTTWDKACTFSDPSLPSGCDAD